MNESVKLKVESIVSGHESNEVLHGVSLDVKEGELVVLIGPNGAGKSTLLKTIMGFIKPKSGKVFFGEEDITSKEPDELVNKGIYYRPQERSVISSMTVDENLDIMVWSAEEGRREEAKERAYELFPVLEGRENQKAGSLSGGERRMVGLASVEALNPNFVMLDEPSLGLAPNLKIKIFEKIMEMNSRGVEVFLVEQEAVRALERTDRAYVLVGGQIRHEGNSEDIIQNEEVKELYLGG